MSFSNSINSFWAYNGRSVARPPISRLTLRLLHTSNSVFKNLAPLLRNPGDGPVCAGPALASAGPNAKPRRRVPLCNGVMMSSCPGNRGTIFLKCFSKIRRQFIGVNLYEQFLYLKGRGRSSCVPTSMFMTNSMLLWWTLDNTATTRKKRIFLKKGRSAMEIRAASASAKLRQSNRTHKRLELPMQLLHSC